MAGGGCPAQLPLECLSYASHCLTAAAYTDGIYWQEGGAKTVTAAHIWLRVQAKQKWAEWLAEAALHGVMAAIMLVQDERAQLLHLMQYAIAGQAKGGRVADRHGMLAAIMLVQIQELNCCS